MTEKVLALTEEWLRVAVEQLDKHVFGGELELGTHEYQIYFGRVRGTKGGETVQPSDNEAVTLEDFFPTTIGIDYQIRDLDTMMATLAYECIKGFMNVSKGKAFNKLCERFYFEKPFTGPHPSPYLMDLLKEALEATIQKVGPFPGRPVKFAVKEKKPKKPTKALFFCPDCGLELTAPLNKLKDPNGLPTCVCGTKMARDWEYGNEEKIEDNTNESTKKENPAGKD